MLLSFNVQKIYNYANLLKRISIPEDRFQRVIMSLMKAKLLFKKPPGKVHEPTDKFKVNENFSHNLYQIKINTIQARATKKEVAKATKAIASNRKLQCDAAVVRIMKSQKTLTHTQLVQEVTKQLRFPYSPKEIKQRIIVLIERDFLERDESNKALYHYLA